MIPKRIQRSRAKGWRMPEGAVYVGRPTKWGNPFTVDGVRDAGIMGKADRAQENSYLAECFRDWLGVNWKSMWNSKESERMRSAVLSGIGELRGKDLACWCRLDQPCHADVLLDFANGPRCDEVPS